MECSICYELIDTNNNQILKCNHVFHKECINKWLKKNNKCPICRKIIIYNYKRIGIYNNKDNLNKMIETYKKFSPLRLLRREQV